MRVLVVFAVLAVLAVLVVLPSVAQTSDHDLYFLGYETEPAMDFGGRTLTSLQSGLSRAFGSIRGIGERQGFLPGLPIEDGIYLGFGILGGW
jgi:hypothetical protein